MKREQAKWSIDPEVSERFDREAREAGMMPNRVLEELIKLWLEYILPKSRNNG